MFDFRAVITFLAGFVMAASAAENTKYLFLPVPREVVYHGGYTDKPLEQLEVTAAVDGQAITNAQGYRLEIKPSQVVITAGSQAGRFYADKTLEQILLQSAGQKGLLLTVNDYPDYEVRGVMLDISRDKVPTMQTLYHLADMMAQWKVNHFQLYTEHTFAYQNHKEVWEKASPMTAEQIRLLDAYCKERFIDLVPNQNSFGHMERWLKYPRYRNLAEAPDYVKTKWGMRRWGTLCPTEPGSIELISGLYDELLPNFSSKYINVGCDETIELGLGRSKELCEQVGMERVYLDYLLKINALVEKHGKTMMFWADMIQHNPDIIKELPQDVVALVWGYEANHPFDKHCATVASTGRRFYVCPGNSTWICLAGRTDNALANLRNAASSGLKHGSCGFVNTDWGDLGDWEPISVSYLPFGYGAAISWSLEQNADADIAASIGRFAFKDNAGLAGKLFYELGNAYKVGDVITSNSSVTGRILHTVDWDLSKTPTITAAKLEEMKAYTQKLLAEADKMDLQTPDSTLVVMEFKHAADMVIHGCDLGIARLAAAENKTANIPQETKKLLAADLRRIIANHKRVWLSRNREGGLSDSLSDMEKLLAAYES